jgi:hypothetical protein
MKTQIIKSMKRFLSIFDIYGEPVRFNFKKQDYYSSWSGIITSLTVWGFIIYLFILLMLDMLDRSEPNVHSRVFSTVKKDVLYSQ